MVALTLRVAVLPRRNYATPNVISESDAAEERGASVASGAGIAAALGLRPSDPTGGGATVGFDIPQ